ncbi:hydrolase [Streptomyces avidinii]
MQVVHGRQGYATMAVLLPDRPMEVNHAENAVMLARETAEHRRRDPGRGCPRIRWPR